MNIKNTAIVTTLFLGLTAGAANAKPTLDPSVSSPDAADKMIVIKDGTRHINVFTNETVLFKTGDQMFAIKFDGVKHEYDLGSLAPDGMLSHKVRVYVTPNPAQPEQGMP